MARKTQRRGGPRASPSRKSLCRRALKLRRRLWRPMEAPGPPQVAKVIAGVVLNPPTKTLETHGGPRPPQVAKVFFVGVVLNPRRRLLRPMEAQSPPSRKSRRRDGSEAPDGDVCHLRRLQGPPKLQKSSSGAQNHPDNEFCDPPAGLDRPWTLSTVE